MADTPPSLYLLYGDDTFGMEAFTATLSERLGDSSTIAMNRQRFDGSSIAIQELGEICFQMPFLAERRLVIIENAQSMPKQNEFVEGMKNLLSELPASTALVCLEHLSSPRRARDSWRRTWLRSWAEEHEASSYVRFMGSPRGQEFVQWILSRAGELEGQINPDAAQLLADWVADDPYLADHEIRKLLDYVDLQREIQVDDVELLTPFRGQGDIFEFVDALGQRQPRKAQLQLARLLDDADPRYVFSMIIRQFRLIILAREALDHGSDPGQVISLPPFLVKRLSAQARTFSASDLDLIYHDLLQTDLGVKTSQIDLNTALDRLIGALAAG
jgi:DNA polymerase-3 subunit delta